MATGLSNSPFGVGTPILAPLPADQQDQKFSRYIDPNTGDYEVYSKTGALAQMPGVRQRVLLIAKTLRGSSSVLPNMGIKLPGKIDEAFVSTVRNSIKEAFREMTDVEKSLRIDGILVNKLTTGRISVVIAYTDLTVPDFELSPLEIIF
tara:strand:+ start:340 stop:786 length:447 start_codon:yes stop_codon:yes gene_type:complete